MMRRVLAGGIAACVLSLFVPPTGAYRDLARPGTVTRTSLVEQRIVAQQTERGSQKELAPNAALVLLFTVALRGLHGS
jgi:hypothetical protein